MRSPRQFFHQRDTKVTPKLHLAAFNVFFSRLGKKGALFFSGKNDISKSRQKVNFTTKMPKLYKKQSYFVLQKVH